MIEWYKMAFQKYADFQTRSTRNEYWWFFLVNLLIIFGVNILVGIFSIAGDAPGLALVGSGLLILYSLATFIPNLAVSIRRLHDTNRSGWFLLLGLIPLVGGIILIVFLAQESDPHPNKWGPVPGSSAGIEDSLVDFDNDLV